MATQKGPVIYRVRNKKTKLERDMPVTVYQHVKRNWDVIGQVVNGQVVDVNPSQPQQQRSPQKGNVAVAIGKVEVPDEVLDTPDVPQADEDDESNDQSQENDNDLSEEDDQVSEESVAQESPQGETPEAAPEPQAAKPKGKPGRKPSAK